MRDETMTIRQMCEAFGVTARTLRFYESRELLAPLRQGQKRLYTRRDRARLTLILRGRRFGFALEEIRQLLELYDLGDGQRTQLAQTVARARDRLAAMEAQRDDLAEAIAELKGQLAAAAAMLAGNDKTSAA
ncbi:MAG: MerR family DNA-binding transcriptional regulator [Rhodobacteraceae bacterium]|nr:MerR family DNA-binding transcriptional regulator [Paracoccaceae bacterium]